MKGITMSDRSPLSFEAFLRRHAHGSMDGVTLAHCPFCGSGAIIARSDGTTECEMCGMCFSVQVQPRYPAFPQTINGQPVPIPGMPDQDPSQAGQLPPGQDPNAMPGQDPEQDPEQDDTADQDQDSGNPFA